MKNVNWIMPLPTTLGWQITRKSNPELEFVSKIIIPDGAFASINFRTYTAGSLEFEGPMTIELGNEKAFAGIDAIGARQPQGGANQIVLLYVSLPVNQAPVDLTSQKPIDIGQ